MNIVKLHGILHRIHKSIKRTWNEYGVYFWLVGVAGLVETYLKIEGLAAYVIVIFILLLIDYSHMHVSKHIEKIKKKRN